MIKTRKVSLRILMKLPQVLIHLMGISQDLPSCTHFWRHKLCLSVLRLWILIDKQNFFGYLLMIGGSCKLSAIWLFAMRLLPLIWFVSVFIIIVFTFYVLHLCLICWVDTKWGHICCSRQNCQSKGWKFCFVNSRYSISFS